MVFKDLLYKNKKLMQIGLIIFLFVFAFSIRFSGGTWETIFTCFIAWFFLQV